MKKNIFLASLFAMGVLTLPSCTDFLTENDPNHIVAENFFSTENDVERAVNGAYMALRSGSCHHNRRLLRKAVADLLHCLRYLLQMSSRYDIRLIHRKIKETVLILRHGTDHGRIPSAASRCHNQHD